MDESQTEVAEEGEDTRDVLLSAATHYLESKLLPRFDRVHSEMALAVDWRSGNSWFLSNAKDRNYPVDQYPDCQFGTMDLMAVSGDTSFTDWTLYVGDWKTGGSDGAEEQLLSLLAGARTAYRTMGEGRPAKMYISTILVTEEGVKPVEREVSHDELDAHVDAMSWRWEDILKGEVTQAVPGIHCTQLYCPHLAHCHAIGITVLDASEGPKGLLKPEYLVRQHRMTETPCSDEEAAYVMERVSAAKRQLNYYTEAMKAYVSSGGTIRSGKYVWGPGKDGFRWRKQ